IKEHPSCPNCHQLLLSTDEQNAAVKGMKAESSNCMACQQTFQNDDFKFCCGHRFHEDCIVIRIQTNPSYPTCQFPLIPYDQVN
ncbi:6384_t:CDS:2, partial [Dentiscutata heterogama]